MKAKGLFKYTANGNGPPMLKPMDARAHKIVSDMYPDRKALVWVHTARYPEHHRFAFAVLQQIADACGVPVDVVLLSLKFETGRFDYVQLLDGRVVENPQSIAFELMGQKEFQEFWNDALVIMHEKWMPRMEGEAYEKLRDMVAGKGDI